MSDLKHYETSIQEADAEHREQHEVNRSETSHANFFADKTAKQIFIDDEEDPSEFIKPLNEGQQRQAVRRVAKLSEAVTNALTTQRVVDARSYNIMRVTFDELERMRQDPGFRSFAQYAHDLMNYTDGRPRPKPLRPLLQHEMGMYGDKIVVLANNPGDGARTGNIVAIPRDPDPWDLRGPDPSPAEPMAAKDPFPSPMTLVKKLGDQ